MVLLPSPLDSFNVDADWRNTDWHPHGLVVDEPYDSLSFLPTMLALTGKFGDDRVLAPSLMEKGFRRLPSRVVKEVISSQ